MNLSKFFQWPPQNSPAIPQAPELNPCFTGTHRKASLWDVVGKVTKVCPECVFALERGLLMKGIQDARFCALDWFFLPDPNGNAPKYMAGYQRPTHPKPGWADDFRKELFVSSVLP